MAKARGTTPRKVVEAAKAAVATLVTAPDVSSVKVPIIDGKPAWFQAVTATGQKVPITKVGTGLDIRPNYQVVSVVFHNLQDAYSVKPDGRIGDQTLGAFKQKVRKLGFIKYPTTVAALAANAVKWTEILRKGVKPDKVGGAVNGSWQIFVKRMAVADTDTIGPGGRLGRFAISPKRLEQLGVMDKVTKVTSDKGSYYDGEFAGKLTLDKFLGSLDLQLQVFERSIEAYLRDINDSPELSGLADTPTQWGPVTLSGLLGLAHAAGLQGANKWVTRPKDRKRFTATTDVFRRVNGLF